MGEALGVLPLHPSSFGLPLPETKGSIKSLLPYLHNETEAWKQASLLVRFNRPLLDQQKRSLPYMFSGKEFLGHLKPAIQVAEEKFRQTMMRISDAVRAKEFDERVSLRGYRSSGIRLSLAKSLITYVSSLNCKDCLIG